MVAFEICMNGKPLEPMEFEGLGSLSVSIDLHRGTEPTLGIYDMIHMMRSGSVRGRDTPDWKSLDLNIGDEITIRIVDSQAPDVPPSLKLFSN